MSKAFNEAVRNESAVKSANIYFHRQHSDAAIELAVRVTSDGKGQVFVTRTQGDLVKSANDVASCDAILLDSTLGPEQCKQITALHDAMGYPYEVHYIGYNTATGVFNMLSESPYDQSTPGAVVAVHTDGRAAGDGSAAPASGPGNGGAVPAPGERGSSRRAGRASAS
jgi:hypothetical protein